MTSRSISNIIVISQSTQRSYKETLRAAASHVEAQIARVFAEPHKPCAANPNAPSLLVGDEPDRNGRIIRRGTGATENHCHPAAAVADRARSRYFGGGPEECLSIAVEARGVPIGSIREWRDQAASSELPRTGCGQAGANNAQRYLFRLF
jgi:hypothetical protein